MAAVEVTLPRNAHPVSNIGGFSVQEDATPLDPSSSEGGVGTITVSVAETPDSPLYIGGVALVDGARGKTSGVIRSTQASDGVLTVTADSILSLFNTERTLAPVVGTLEDAVRYYCDVVDIPNDVVVDPTVASRAVVYPGGRGNVWVRVKQMLAAQQVEMSLVFDRVFVRPPRLIEADTSRMSTQGWSVSNSSASRTVEVNYFPTQAGSQMEVYPRRDDDPQIFVVDAGETQTIEQQIDATLTHVNQPVATYSVANTTFEGTAGVYSIVGVDDLPIPPSQWRNSGGSLTVEITEDPSVLKIVLRGANIPHLSPFRVAMSSGSGTYYNSLHITGTGVSWTKDSITLTTGATNLTTSTDVGVVVDNPYITSRAQAYSVGLHTAAKYSGLEYSISGTAFSLNRKSDNRELIGATIEDFNSANSGKTIAGFNAEWSGSTFADFNSHWQSQADSRWENQLFGNAPGARIKREEANFRVTSATTSETSVPFTASLDTTIQDFNEVWAGETIADFNARFSGYTLREFSIVPLRSPL